MIISRAVAAPSRWTFTIRPIAELVKRYVGDGMGWVDPFAGMNSPAELTNDMDPETPAMCHMEAGEFCAALVGTFAGVLFDPPYSKRQISEHYKACGKKATSLDTSDRFYNRVKNPICDKIRPGGLAISFGWNSHGFGQSRGFEIIEILLVSHGQGHNDTIVTVERKVSP
jgi:hypothetical protein